MQRRVVALLSPLMPGTSGTLRYRTSAHRVPVEVVAPKRGDTGGAILYLHGGAFCLGGPHTHRGVTTRLANDAGLPVWVPDYRLAPEHPARPRSTMRWPSMTRCVRRAMRRTGS